MVVILKTNRNSLKINEFEVVVEVVEGIEGIVLTLHFLSILRVLNVRPFLVNNDAAFAPCDIVVLALQLVSVSHWEILLLDFAPLVSEFSMRHLQYLDLFLRPLVAQDVLPDI